MSRACVQAPARRRALAALGAASVLALLSACASAPPRTATSAGEAHWEGRLAVKVYSSPIQAFSADFELQGNPQHGTLTLSTPLGTTLARMQWDGESATLDAQGRQRRFDSLSALARESTGTELPVTSLFAWLQGRDEPAPGWRTDLGELPQGRLQAWREAGVPAELRILLTR